MTEQQEPTQETQPEQEIKEHCNHCPFPLGTRCESSIPCPYDENGNLVDFR